MDGLTGVRAEVIDRRQDFADLANEIAGAQWDTANDIDREDYTAQSLREFVEAEHTVLVVARVDGGFAGLAVAHVILQPRRGGRWLYVDELDTAVDARRRGVGLAMLVCLRSWAREHGCFELALGADNDNAAAIGLYRAFRPSSVESIHWYCFSVPGVLP